MKPRKRFGQNFLKDEAILDAIISLINPKEEEQIIEIGPGQGALTKRLKGKISAIEIDRDLIAFLKISLPHVQIIEADALSFDFSSLGHKFRLVGNLPYNISTPLLFHFSTFIDQVIDQHFMLQKEVVERMVASPSSKAYGRLSVMLQWRYDMEMLLEVPPDAFYPAPKVNSAIVKMIPKKNPLACDEKALSQTVATAFMKRRKTIKNALSPLLNDEDFEALGMDQKLRPEDLSVKDFVSLASRLSKS